MSVHISGRKGRSNMLFSSWQTQISRRNSDIPVSVAEGTCGSPIFLSTSSCSSAEPRALRTSFFLQPFKEYLWCLLGAGAPPLSTNSERNADIETIMTAILDSCCCQKASHTMSTFPPSSLMPAILTIATMTITSERQSQNPMPTFCRVLMWTCHRVAMGNESTMKSVTTSITVVMAVSRMTR